MASRRGFTMLELLLAILLFSIGIAAALQITVMSLRMAQQTFLELQAIKGIQEYYVEYLRSLNFADTRLNQTAFKNCDPQPAHISSRSLEPTLGPAGASCTYRVQDLSADLKLITVQVGWTDASNRARTLSATTEIARPAP